MSEKANKYQQALLDHGRSRPKSVMIEGVNGVEFEVLMLPLNVGQHQSYHFDMLGKDGKPEMSKLRAAQEKLVQMCCVTEDCTPAYRPADLISVDHVVLERMFKAAQKISSLDRKAEADEGND